MKWPWSKPDEYCATGRQLPTATDKMGMTLERVKETVGSLDKGIDYFKYATECIYTQALSLVQVNRKLVEEALVLRRRIIELEKETERLKENGKK